MKKTKFFSLLMLVMLFLVSCSPRFPKVTSYYISPFELTDEEKFWREDLTLRLNPDGSSVIVGGRYLANLVTGEREDLYRRFKVGRDTTIKNHDILDGDITFWSFDGHYLGMLANHYESGRDPVGYATYIFDLRDNAFRRYDIRGTSFSPFNSYQVTSDKGIYNLKDGTVIPYPVDFNLNQEQEFGATDYGTLWSKSLGAPVAELGSLPHPDNADVEVALQSYNPMDPVHPKYSIPVGLTVKYPNQLARILFNPTGEYILALEWQCSESQTLCSDDSLFPNNVHDTVLTIIRWRTGEQKELIRLSEIDSEHVVAYGYMAWSADGSTIFISRKDALPIVLKVKYP